MAYKLYRKDIANWVSIQHSGIPDFLFSETVPEGFVEFDTIENIYAAFEYAKILRKNGIDYFADFKFKRDRIKDKFLGWSSHSNSEKLIFCNLKIGSDDDRIAYMDSIYGSGNGFKVIQNLTAVYAYKATTQSRGIRSSFAYNEIWSRLDVDDARDIGIKGKDAFLNYTQLGFDGTINNDPASVYDFIYGVVGTVYENAGIKHKPYTRLPRGFNTIDEFCDFLNNIVVNGECLNLNLAKTLNLI